jgi:hypothetical protein
VIFRNKPKTLIERADEIDRQITESPFEPVEVESDLAEHMGAFAEDAVGVNDFMSLEPGVLDDFYGRGIFRSKNKRPGGK